jgi:hypothetical protein
LPRLGQPHDVDPARFGATDCRGIEFVQPPRARVRVGERFTVEGRVTARDRTDFSQLLLRFWPSTDEEPRVERVSGSISGSSSFRIDVELRDGQQGLYSVELFLFWPGSGAQSPRCRITPMVVSSGER